MANNAAHYRLLASRAQDEADAATLENVRDRALKSAAAFEAMALQQERMAEGRAERDAASHGEISDDRGLSDDPI